MALRRLTADAVADDSRQHWLGAAAPFRIRQTPVRVQSRVPLAGAGISLAVSRRNGRTLLYAVSDGFVEVFDLEAPTRPRLAGQLSYDGVQGIVRLGAAHLAWGKAGVARVPDDLRGAVEPVNDIAVDAISALLGRLFVLTGDEVLVFDGNLRLTYRFGADGARTLNATSRNLVLASADLVRVLDVTVPGQPQLASELPLATVGSLAAERTEGGHLGVFAPSDDGGGLLLDIAKPGEPRAAVRYARAPWFTSTVRAGSVLARIGEDEQEALILAAGIPNIV